MAYAATKPAENRKVILVVDDEIIIRLVIADYLRDEGYKVIEAGSADEALDYIKTSKHVSLVFSDVRMPGSMDGVELALQVGLIHPGLPVILASGHLLPGEAGETPLVPKPYLLAEVAAKIGRLLDGAAGDEPDTLKV